MVDCISKGLDGLYRNIKFLGIEFHCEIRGLLYIKWKRAKASFFSATMKIKFKGISCRRWEKYLLAQTSRWQCISCFWGGRRVPSADLTCKSCVWLLVDKIIINYAVPSCKIVLYANKHLRIELNLEMALLRCISSPFAFPSFKNTFFKNKCRRIAYFWYSWLIYEIPKCFNSFQKCHRLQDMVQYIVVLTS